MTGKLAAIGGILLLACVGAWAQAPMVRDPNNVPPEVLKKVAPIDMSALPAPADVLKKVPPIDLSALPGPEIVLNQVPPLDVAGMATMAWFNVVMQSGQTKTQGFAAWAKEHGVKDETLAAALGGRDLDYSFPGTLAAVETALYQRRGDGPEAYSNFPAGARAHMAVYFGLRGKEDEAKQLLLSIPPGEATAWPTRLYLGVAESLVEASKCPHLVIWAAKREVELRGKTEELAAFPVILWACRQLAVQDYKVAAEELRAIISSGQKGLSDLAQVDLLKLAQVHPEIEAASILAPAYYEASPDRLRVSLKVGEQGARKVTVVGSPTLLVQIVACDKPWVKATAGERRFTDDSSVQEVALDFGPVAEPGDHVATLVLETNDPMKKAVQIPLSVEVMGTVDVRPDSLFFGFMKPGETKAVTTTLTSGGPFEIKQAKSDKPELISVQVKKQDNGSYCLQASLKAPEELGIHEGAISISFASGEDAGLVIPYYVNVGGPSNGGK